LAQFTPGARGFRAVKRRRRREGIATDAVRKRLCPGRACAGQALQRAHTDLLGDRNLECQGRKLGRDCL